MDRSQLLQLKEQNPFAALHDIICDLLMQDIISFRLAPGSRVVESNVAECFGVSRSPVRTALDILCRKGYLYQSGRSYFVKEFSQKEFKDLGDLSRMIEPYAAGEAAEKLTTAQMDRLYEMAYKLQTLYHEATGETLSSSFMPLMDMEYQFHTFIVDAAQNEVISKIYEDYKYRILYYRSYILQNPPKDVLTILADDHLRICDTLKLRDKDMAIAVANRHISISQRVIKKSQVLECSWGEAKDITASNLD